MTAYPTERRYTTSASGRRYLIGDAASPKQPRLPGGLTAWQARVLQTVANGLSKEEAGERLGISPSTIKSHLGRIYARLGARNAAHAVSIAYQLGVFPTRHQPPGDQP